MRTFTVAGGTRVDILCPDGERYAHEVPDEGYFFTEDQLVGDDHWAAGERGSGLRLFELGAGFAHPDCVLVLPVEDAE